jgi:hypothetical protein
MAIGIDKIKAKLNVDGTAKIGLFNGSRRVAECTNNDVDVGDFDSTMGISKATYTDYLRFLVENLLVNGGIEGYFIKTVRSEGYDEERRDGTYQDGQE